MDPEVWQRIERIYNRALELEPGRRADYIKGACAGDDSLRTEVERLLARQSEAEHFIESPAIEVVARALAEDQLPGAGRNPTEPPWLKPGSALLHYRIVGKIGEGGMGEVFRAHDERLSRDVAIKSLPNFFAGDPQLAARLEREAKLLASLNHPNIAAIHGLEESDGKRFIVMELVRGQTLAQRLLKGPLPVNEAVEVCRQIAEGLEAAHEKGVIHRDLKPGNVMITADDKIKILDFGLAKALEAESQPADPAHSPTLTEATSRPGAVVGTAAYMSPEQARGKTVDKRADIWAFGCVLYECLTGKRAFQGKTVAETFVSILQSEPDWRALPPVMPRKLTELLRRCLKKDPRERLRDIGDARIEMQEQLALPEEPIRVSQRLSLCWLITGSVITLVIGALIAVAVLKYSKALPPGWLLSRQKADVVAEPLRIVPFTSLPGMEAAPRFSPDGKFVAFARNGPAKNDWDIYVKQVGRGEPLRLTTDPAIDWSPVWSPDGSEIAFVRFSGEAASIYTVPSLGGAERELYESKAALLGIALSWSPDGRWLTFSERSAVDTPARICLLSPDTRNKTPLTSPPPTSYGDLFPEFSPDGKRVAFCRRASWAAWDIWLQPVPSGEAARLTHENYDKVGRPTWTTDGREIVFAARYALFRVPVTGGVPQAVAGIGENPGDPTIWRNQMIFTQSLARRSRIWRMRGPNYGGRDRAPAPLLEATRYEFNVDYSPDGKKLAFSSLRSGSFEIWICGSDGSNPVQLTELRKMAGNPRWSPDGRQIAFSGRLEEVEEVYVIDADGGIPRRLTDEKSNNEVPTWSRDGKWIYFSSNRSGTFQVWKMPSEGGKAIQITTGGGYYAMESFDGKKLYHFRPGKGDFEVGQIWKAPRDGGEETMVLDREIRWAAWALRPEGIYFSTMTGKYAIEFLSFQTGQVANLYQEETPNLRESLAISPDGEWFVYSDYPPPQESDLMLVENFR